MNVNEAAPGQERKRHREYGVLTKNGTPHTVKDIAVVAQGPKIRLGQFARATHRRRTGKSSITTMWSLESRCCARARTRTRLWRAPRESGRVEQRHSATGVKLVPMIDRSDSGHFTTETVLHNLTEGFILVTIVLMLFLGNLRAALIVALTIPFALLFASILLDSNHIPANLLSLGALGFRHGGGWRGGDGGKYRPSSGPSETGDVKNRWQIEFATPRMKCSGRCSMRSRSSSPLICRSSLCSGSKAGCSGRWPGR